MTPNNSIVHRAIEPRVNQLDASILDSELMDLLKNQLWAAFKHFHPQIKDKYEPELLLVLKLLLFKVTIWDHSATYGAKLQNLRLVHTKSTVSKLIPMSQTQKILYGLITAGGSYMWGKLEDYLAKASVDEDENSWSRRLRSFADLLTTAWTTSSLFNFVAFLYSGRYSTLILRLLRIRFVPASRSLTRQVNFEFQNRQLVWNALTEFLLFILPLLNLPKLKRKAARLLGGKTSKSQGELSFLPVKTCAICYKTSADSTSTDITNPYQGECGHIYCYVCLTNQLAEDPEEGWSCLRCGSTIKTAVPWTDVREESIVVREESKLADQTTDTSVEYFDSDEDQEYVMEEDIGGSEFIVEGSH
jgi:peroxin-2